MQQTDPQKVAHLAGWFFIATFVTSIPAALLYGPLLHHHDYIVGSGSQTQIEVGAFSELLLLIANIGTAVVLFPIVKRQSESISLGYVASRIVESGLIAVGIVSVLAVVKLRHDLAGTTTDKTSLILTGRQLVAVHNWTFLLGPSFGAAFGNGILLGTLMYRSGLVPRRLALIGVIGGPLAFIAATGALFSVYDQNSTAQAILTIPEIVWEASLGIYLIVKGFRSAGLRALDIKIPGSPGLAPTS
jgi:hypothetical protein